MIHVHIKKDFNMDSHRLNVYEYYLLIEQMVKNNRRNG